MIETLFCKPEKVSRSKPPNSGWEPLSFDLDSIIYIFTKFNM